MPKLFALSLLLVLSLSGCSSEAIKLSAYCQHVSGLIEQGLISNTELVATTGAVSTMSLDVWYAEWEGQPIPIPKLESGWKNSKSPWSVILSHKQYDYTLSVGVGFTHTQEKLISEQLLEQFQLKNSSLSRFARLKLGLALTPELVACDTKNPQQTIDEYSALIDKTFGELSSFTDKAFILENGAILSRMKNGTAFSWGYFFPNSKGLIRRISITAKWADPPDFFGALPYMNGEPIWLEEFMLEAERVSVDSLDELERLTQEARNRKKEELKPKGKM